MIQLECRSPIKNPTPPIKPATRNPVPNPSEQRMLPGVVGSFQTSYRFREAWPSFVFSPGHADHDRGGSGAVREKVPREHDVIVARFHAALHHAARSSPNFNRAAPPLRRRRVFIRGDAESCRPPGLTSPARLWWRRRCVTSSHVRNAYT